MRPRSGRNRCSRGGMLVPGAIWNSVKSWARRNTHYRSNMCETLDANIHHYSTIISPFGAARLCCYIVVLAKVRAKRVPLTQTFFAAGGQIKLTQETITTGIQNLCPWCPELYSSCYIPEKHPQLVESLAEKASILPPSGYIRSIFLPLFLISFLHILHHSTTLPIATEAHLSKALRWENLLPLFTWSILFISTSSHHYHCSILSFNTITSSPSSRPTTCPKHDG